MSSISSSSSDSAIASGRSSRSTDSLFSYGAGTFLTCSKLSVEPILFAVFLAGTLTEALNTNTLLMRSCLITFNYTHSQCSGIRDPLIEKNVQVYTSYILLGKAIAESGFGVIFALFVGPWTDLNGRKPVLLFPLVGYFFYYLIWALLSQFQSVPPIFFMLASLFPMFTGGLTIIFTAVYCYLNDITTNSNRGFRMTMASIALSFGILFGYLLSPFLQAVYPSSYSIVTYCTAMMIILFTSFYVVYCVPETITFVEHDGQKEELFTLYHIKEMIRVTFSPRPAYGRFILFTIFFMVSLDITVLLGNSSFFYMIVEKSLGWKMADYNFYSAAICSLSIVVSWIGMWLLNKVLKFREITISLFVALSASLSSVCFALSTKTSDLYLSGLMGSLTTIFSPSLKSEMASIFPPEDAGKIYSLLSAVESLTPFAASACYTALYDAVVGYKPQYLFYLSALIWFITALCAVLVIIIQNTKGTNYDILNEEREEVEERNREERKEIT